jgi:hypothetical protein
MKATVIRKIAFLLIIVISVTSVPLLSSAKQDDVSLTVIELVLDEGSGSIKVNAIPPTDDSRSNPDYKLLSYRWYTTVNYYVNPSNRYSLSASQVVNAITTSVNTWDGETRFQIFSYKDTTTRSAGKRDGYNVVSWESYKKGVIAVTYLWSISGQLIETDTKLNTFYGWSLTGEVGKMDVQNIMTHEFGHWCGLNDLYANSDYWLTMYGYSNYGVTYQRTLGLGDILGLQAMYGK